MSVNETGKELLQQLKAYQEILKEISEEDFVLSPAPGSWSFSEVYCHITHVNKLSLLAIEKCLHGKQSAGNYTLPILSRIILFVGKFPPFKIKVPPGPASSIKKISREDARNELIKLGHRLDTTLSKMARSSSHCRIQHPRLGMLNSEQWLQFMSIHTRHHLKQITKIKKTIRK